MLLAAVTISSIIAKSTDSPPEDVEMKQFEAPTAPFTRHPAMKPAALVKKRNSSPQKLAGLGNLDPMKPVGMLFIAC